MRKSFFGLVTLVILVTLLRLLQPLSADAVTLGSSSDAPGVSESRLVTVWLQATDSCEEGLPGASFSLVGASGQAVVAPLTWGTRRTTIGNAEGACPLAHGNCVRYVTGCTRWQIPVPATGAVTYRIVENTTKAMANGLVFAENPTGPHGSALLGFVPCTGGSACHSESATVTVSSSGSISAIVSNVAPDRSVQTYGPFAATSSDPVLFHNYGVGSDYQSDPCVASAGNVQMNYGTGTQSAHCRYVA